MAKPRLLIPISLQFSVRYLLRTGMLQRLNQFCEPVVLLGWRDESLERELAAVSEVHSMVKAKWGGRYEQVRGVLNAWHQRRFASPSTAIRERRADLDRSVTERWKRRIKLRSRALATLKPGAVKSLLRQEANLFWEDTNAGEVRRQVDGLRLDAIFCLTPFLQDEEMAVRAAAMGGMPSTAAILSFDNLTTRSWIPMLFDSYLLWNRHNAEQLRRGYPESSERQVTLVGSPQFDFYARPEYIQEESQWRKSLSLPADRPVILFGGGYYTCAPHEPRFLAQLDDAIETRQISNNPIILFRRHPVDPMDRWEPVLKSAKHVVHDDPWKFGSKILGHTNISDQDIAKLASTLRHTSVHVNVASTMTIDGAFFDRPQVGPAYDDSPGGKYHTAALECYQQEHFLPILESEGLEIARNRPQLIEAVSAGLLRPEERAAGRKGIIQEICTYADGRCTERVVDALETFLRSVPQGRKTAEIVA